MSFYFLKPQLDNGSVLSCADLEGRNCTVEIQLNS